MSGAGLRLGQALDFNLLRADWARLARLSRRIFSTPEWAEAWWSSYARGRRSLILPMLDSDDRVVAIMPLCLEERWPLRLARFLGHGAADELGPVCHPADGPRVGDHLRERVGSPPLSVDILLFDASPEIERWDQLVGGSAIHTSSSPSATFSGTDWDDYLRSLSRNQREQVRRRERRLFREHDARYRVTTDGETLVTDLDTFFDLHRARWPSGSSLLGREPFYRDFAARALENGWLRLSFLEVGGRAVASHLDFSYAGVHFQYNSGRDSRWDEYSVGGVLRWLTMRNAFQEGVTEYRFLRGGEAYKWRIADHDRGSAIVAVPGTRLGRIAVQIARRLARSRSGRDLLLRRVPDA